MNNIPEEVLWVVAITGPYNGTFHCGLELYQKINSIIDKYPEYFPQEHIYKNIPQSVKDLFSSEKYELYKKNNPFYNDIKEGEGLVAFIERKNQESINKPKENLIDVILRMNNDEQEYQKQLEILHNKHFKSYGYKFTKT
ncbi:MAG: hypothetical protein H7Y10_03705 [Flavobacterium sp.]|nr:hypothetical protein [Flavobacterium sp.]